jgi:branched-chain amino acid transport system substrate-binding protein
MYRRIPVLHATLVAMLAAAGLSGCGQVTEHRAPSPLLLGAVLPLTGAASPIGTMMVPALKLAVKEANDAGGVLGRRVELVTGDDACDPGSAVTEANAMVAKGITVSVGGLCSAATVPTLKIFRRAGVPMIIPGANSTDLLTPEYNSVFLLAGTTAIEARHAVEWMHALDGRRMALVGDGTSFSSTVVATAAETARASGSGITVAAELKLTQGAAHYPRIVESVLASRADMVFFTGYYAEAANLIRDLRAARYPGEIMLSDGGVDPALFTKVTPAQVEGVLGLALPLAAFEPRAAAWSARYQAAAGTPPGPFTMQAYDAVRLALDAVRRAGTVDRAAVRAAIAATQPGNVDLLSGPSKFNANGTQVDPAFIRLKVRNGAFTLARPGPAPGR